MKIIIYLLIVFTLPTMAFVDTEYTINTEDQNFYDLNEYNLSDDENYFQSSNEQVIQSTLDEDPNLNTVELVKEFFETRKLLDELLKK